MPESRQWEPFVSTRVVLLTRQTARGGLPDCLYNQLAETDFEEFVNGDCQGFGWIGVIRGLLKGYSRLQPPNQINIFDSGVVRNRCSVLSSESLRAISHLGYGLRICTWLVIPTITKDLCANENAYRADDAWSLRAFGPKGGSAGEVHRESRLQVRTFLSERREGIYSKMVGAV